MLINTPRDLDLVKFTLFNNPAPSAGAPTIPIGRSCSISVQIIATPPPPEYYINLHT